MVKVDTTASPMWNGPTDDDDDDGDVDDDDDDDDDDDGDGDGGDSVMMIRLVKVDSIG